jgi:hypothetical protein
MALFRFPNATIAADAAQKIAVRAANGKFYQVTVQDIIDLAVTGGALPSIADDGTDVVIDADVEITGTIKASGLPIADPLEDNALWLDSGVVTMSSGTP